MQDECSNIVRKMGRLMTTQVRVHFQIFENFFFNKQFVPADYDAFFHSFIFSFWLAV